MSSPEAFAPRTKSRPFAKLWYVYKRELSSLFLSPLAYVAIAMFLLISGYFFSVELISSQYAEMRSTFANMGMAFLFMAPVLTMRLLAEERRTGTDELLLTSPVSIMEIVVGKYLAAVTIYLIGISFTAVYPWYITRFGSPDMGPIYSGYLGLFLLGSTFLSIGLFASSLTDNQMIAGIIGFAMLILMWVFGWAGSALQGTVWGKVLNALDVTAPFVDFHKGMIDSYHIMFYLSYIVAFLFLAVRSVERRRWS